MEKDNRTKELNNPASEQRSSLRSDDQSSATKIVIIKSSGHQGAWWALGTLVIVLIVLAAMWMWGQSTALSNLSGTVNQNNASQSSQLSGIQATLHSISLQLSQLQTTIANLFAKLLHVLHP